MSDNFCWLIKVKAPVRPRAEFRWWRRAKCWGAKCSTRQEALGLGKWLLAHQIHFTCSKRQDKPRVGNFVRRKGGRGPILQVIEGSPRERLIQASRELEWQRDREEFSAGAPQRAAAPLPQPNSAPSVNRHRVPLSREESVIKSGRQL